MSRFYAQPLTLTASPARYPTHGYTGPGIIVSVRFGSRVIGHLTRQGSAVGWDASPAPETDEAAVSDLVVRMLAEGAAAARPLDDVWREILATVQHDSYVYAPLDGLQGG